MSKCISVLLFLILFCAPRYAEASHASLFQDQRHHGVSMRMIGHQVLLTVGDSSSLVLPVEKVGDQYRIRFGTEFGFAPEHLAATIDSVVRVTKIAKSYIVEFVNCDSNQVVHSYEIGGENDLLACRGRDYPVDCYELWITLLDTAFDTAEFVHDEAADLKELSTNETEKDSSILPALSLLLLVAALGLVALFLKRKTVREPNPNVVRIGEFQFNTRTMELSIDNDRIALTSKESDLLQLLSASANETLEREDILKNVWGDEGDYVGRTLDVFISKLRKKLEADSTVKIVNVRGVGYKLVLM